MDDQEPVSRVTGGTVALVPSRIVTVPVGALPSAPIASSVAAAVEAVPQAAGERATVAAARAPVDTPTAGGAVRRPAVEARRPYHLGVALGVSAGIYAGSLAAVSILQFDHDRALIADRQPVSDAISLLGRHNDESSASLQRAGMVFEDAAARYGDLAAGLESLHDDVVRLGNKLTQINGLAKIDGSGLGVVHSSGGTAASIPRTAPKGGGSAPPATTASTGASGAP